ncbi:MAG: hypothetical protein WCS26_08940 [Arcobacteraceae bacterium]
MSCQLLNRAVNYANYEDFSKDFDKFVYYNKYEVEDRESIKLLKEMIADGKTVCHLFYENDLPVGLLSLSFENVGSSDGVALSITALCVDYLFVSYNFRNKNFCTCRISHKILDFAIKTLYDLNNTIGTINNLILLPANNDVKNFYLDYGFESLSGEWLYFSIAK